MEQLQSRWLTASSYMGKYLRISSYIRNLFLIYYFATTPLWISLYMRKIGFSFLSVYDSCSICVVDAEDVQLWEWPGDPLRQRQRGHHSYQVPIDDEFWFRSESIELFIEDQASCGRMVRLLPFPPIPWEICLSFSVFPWVVGRAYWRERRGVGGRGAKSYDHEKVGPSINPQYSLV